MVENQERPKAQQGPRRQKETSQQPQVLPGLPGWLTRMPDCSSEDFGVPLGKIMDIPVKLHFTYFLVFLLLLIIGLISKKGSKVKWIIFLAYGPLLLLTLLAHEICRAWYVKRYTKGETKKIVLWPLGGYCFTATNITDEWEDIKVALVGPAVHIPMMIFWFVILALCGLSAFGEGSNDAQILQQSGPLRFMAELSNEMFLLNLTIFALNLLAPAYPLACARFTAAYTIKVRGNDTHAVALYLGIAGMIMFVPLLIVAIFLQKKGSSLGVFLMTICFYVFTGACKLTMMAKQNQHLMNELFARSMYGGNSASPTRRQQGHPQEQPRDVESQLPASPKKKQNAGPSSSSKPKEHKKRFTYDVNPEDPLDSKNERK